MITFDQLLDIDDYTPQILEKSNVIEKKHTTPWIDKYRPFKLNQVISQNEVLKMLNNTLKSGVLPHLLFYGPPGTGKTSVILAIARQLFGPKNFKERVMELNASDERGINVVRNKIITFAKSLLSSPDPNYPSPPYKIIILDEADAMTTEAQSALRKVLEDTSSITRFCFICNYINQIIEPINSRCMRFRFKQIDNASIIKKLRYISRRENLIVSDDGLLKIAGISNGDMRRSIMLLQNLKYVKHDITLQDIDDIGGSIPLNIKNKIKKICINKKTNVGDVVQLAQQIRADAFSFDNLIKVINDLIVTCDISDEIKAHICLHIAKVERRVIEGGDEYIELLSILMFIRTITETKKN